MRKFCSCVNFGEKERKFSSEMFREKKRERLINQKSE